MKFSNSVFFMNQKYLGLRVIPQNIFKYFCFRGDIHEKRFFCSDFQVTILIGNTISRYRNRDILQCKTYMRKLKEIMAKIRQNFVTFLPISFTTSG